MPQVEKLISMGEGFTSYSTATASAPDAPDADPSAPATAPAAPAPAAAKPSSSPGKTGQTGAAVAAAAASSAAGAAATDELVDVLLSADGTYVQQPLSFAAAPLAAPPLPPIHSGSLSPLSPL